MLYRTSGQVSLGASNLQCNRIPRFKRKLNRGGVSDPCVLPSPHLWSHQHRIQHHSLPLADPASPLGSELVSCDKADGVEPVSLPGAKGDIKLDRCYRGRDRLVCSFRALSSEAKTLLENYRNIVEANYPELGSVDDVCRIKPHSLATDLKSAAEFSGRFRVLKAEYDARVNCANKVEQSLRDVNLPDMTQAPAVLKSMIDSIEADIKGVSAPQAQVVEFAERINSSHKALATIEKIHQTMCGGDQTAKMDPEDGTAVTSVTGRVARARARPQVLALRSMLLPQPGIMS